MTKDKTENQIIMYTTADGATKVRVNVDPKQNTVWLTQEQMADLFGVDISGVSRHINNVFDDGELDRESNLQKMQITGFKPTTHYSLDVIISVGYRVNSLRGTQFRIWATKILFEYIKKGFAMNDDLLKEAGGTSRKEKYLKIVCQPYKAVVKCSQV